MNLSLRSQVYLLTIIPLMAVMAVVSALSVQESRALGQREIELFESEFLNLRRRELKNYLDLALTAIHAQRQLNTDRSREQAKQILREMGFGNDGYYFVYNYDGVNLAHPKKPELEGENLYEFKDPAGNPVIQSLIDRAREGGGFHEYLWEKPSRSTVVGKLGYAVGLDDWGWMIGTGLYTDDLVDAISEIRRKVDDNIQRTLITSVAVALVGVTLVTLLGLTINISETRLADSRLKELSQRTIQFEENEKYRVSRELHDGINQMLVSVRYRLEALVRSLDPSARDARDHAEQACATIQSAIAEVRRISQDMRPLVLDDIGLAAALRSLAESVPLDVEVSIDQRAQRFPTDVETALYRVAQEALTNIRRHAAADRVYIRLSSSKGWTTLEIEDTGCGFDDNERVTRDSGLGLRNMRERVEFLNGAFSVYTVSGRGSRVVARVPVS